MALIQEGKHERLESAFRVLGNTLHLHMTEWKNEFDVQTQKPCSAEFIEKSVTDICPKCFIRTWSLGRYGNSFSF